MNECSKSKMNGCSNTLGAQRLRQKVSQASLTGPTEFTNDGKKEKNNYQ